ncbi:MAG TPA: autotransporter-associated beta strand repeat-containing protein [Chthoniobacteraceae bacterium]|nr:autotransporter-associated beta strand repeat-containing protein [Chthoniobacteraceae bacterium]
MKSLKIPLLAGSLCVAFAISAQAADPIEYTGALPDGDVTTGHRWSLVTWTPDGTPGADDDVLDLSYFNPETEAYGTSLVRLDQNISVRHFKKTTSNIVYIQPYAASQTLAIAQNFEIATGSYQIRSRTTGVRLTISAANLYLGGGSLVLDTRQATQKDVTLQISGNTVLSGASSYFQIKNGADANTIVHLGNVLFKSTLSGASSGMNLEGGTVTVATLNDETGSEGKIRNGGGTNTGVLKLTGNAGDPGAPEGDPLFRGKITGLVRLEKTGSAVQILSGTGNDYTGGTVISGGHLLVNGEQGLGVGAVVVENGGTLGGSGGIGLGDGHAITVKSGGKMAPGGLGTALETLTISGVQSGEARLLEMEEGSRFVFRLDASGQSESLRFDHYEAGDLLLAPGGIAVDVSGSLAEGVVYQLFTFYDAEENLISSGLVSGLVAGSGFEGFEAHFDYDEPGKILMTVTVIPEPSVAGLVGAVGLIAIFWKRRRKAAR